MTRTQPPTVVIVPGLRGHVAGHWQTLLAERLGTAVTVPPPGRGRRSRAARVAALDRAVAGVPGPVILVAHSAGVMTTVHWAQRHSRPVQGALLATPPDFGSPLPDGYPMLDELYDNGWCPAPCDPLPFPSILAASSNDPLARIDRVAALAAAWGSRLVHAGAVGHLNPASGYGHWARAGELIRELTATAATRHSARVATRAAARRPADRGQGARASAAGRCRARVSRGGRVREIPAVSGSGKAALMRSARSCGLPLQPPIPPASPAEKPMLRPRRPERNPWKGRGGRTLMGPFRDYRQVIHSAGRCCDINTCAATRSRPALLRQVFLTIVERSWDPAEVCTLRRAASSALL